MVKKSIFHLILSTAITTMPGLFAIAQPPQTTVTNKEDDTTNTFYIFQSALDNPHFELIPIDTSLNAFHNYEPTKRLAGTYLYDTALNEDEYKGNLEYIANPGVPGSLSKSMVVTPAYPAGIRLGISGMDPYSFKQEHIKYYHLRAPLTELYYVLGSKKEQFFKVLHSQNITENFNAGFEYRMLSGDGFYSHQKTKHSNFKAFTWFKSGRYNLIANGLWNNFDLEENGGIAADSLFEETKNITKNTIPVNLTDARNKWKNHQFLVKQYFDFGKQRVSYEASYHSNLFNYRDDFPDTPFYKDIFIDSSQTNDKSQFIKAANTVGWTTVDAASALALGETGYSAKFNAGLNLRHEYAEYHQNTVDTFLTGILTKGFLGNSSYSKLNWRLEGDYGIDGALKGDYSASVHFTCRLAGKSKGLFNFSSGILERTASLADALSSANHFQWNNRFEKINTLFGTLEFSEVKFRIKTGISAYLVNNYVYYNEKAIPAQFSNDLGIVKFYLVKDFTWRFMVLKNSLIYQYVSGSRPINLPALIGYHSLYINSRLFKNALYAQLGADLYYNSSYYADAYMPASGRFYNQFEKKVGDYPYVDLFLNFMVSHARIFLKVSHLNSGLSGNTYYTVPHYPMPDRAYKFGISWMFYD